MAHAARRASQASASLRSPSGPAPAFGPDSCRTVTHGFTEYYVFETDNHAIGDSFFLNAFRTDPAPSAWRANPDSSTVSSTLSPGPSPWSHGAGVRTAGPAPKRPLPLGGLHPGKGRSSRQLCPPSQGAGKAEGRAGEPHRPAGRARGGGRGPASWSREERLSPRDSAGPVRIRRLAAPQGAPLPATPGSLCGAPRPRHHASAEALLTSRALLLWAARARGGGPRD